MKLWHKKLLEIGFENKPKGWSDKSIKKAGSTLAKGMGLNNPKDKGFFDKCVSKMTKHMGDGAKGYCASLKDEAHGGDKASTYWRGKDKTKKQTKNKIQNMRRKFKGD